MATTDEPTVTPSGTSVAPAPSQQVQDTSSIWYNVNTLLRDLGVVIGFAPVFITLYKNRDFSGIVQTVQSSEFITPIFAIGAVAVVIWRQFNAWRTEAKVQDK